MHHNHHQITILLVHDSFIIGLPYDDPPPLLVSNTHSLADLYVIVIYEISTPWYCNQFCLLMSVSHPFPLTFTSTHTHTHTSPPPPPTAHLTSISADLSVQHSTHLLSCNFNPDGLTGSPDKDTSEGGSNVKTSSPPYDYVQRKLSLTVTAFAWLPALLKMDLDSKLNNLALVAMATRLGNVVLMGVEVPVVNER